MEQTRQHRVALAGAILLLIGFTCAAYSNALSGPFLLDDVPRIANDPKIRSAWPPWPVINSTNRPLSHYTFALNYAVHGYDTRGYHLTNVAIHLLAAVTLLGVVRRSWLLLRPGNYRQALGLGTAVALLWAVHPLNTQAVTYIVQRLESMMGLFYLLTLYCFIRGQTSAHRWGWYACSIAACAAGMSCKEVMVTAPVVVLWYGRSIAKSFAQRWDAIYYGLLMATWAVLAWAMWHYQTDYRGGGLLSVKDLTPWTYLTNQSAIILHYLRLVFWPDAQCAYYAWPVEHSWIKLLPTMIVVASMLVASVYLSFARPALGMAAMSFFIVLAPTSSLVPVIDLAFEHRMYLPLAAILTLVCIAVGQCLGLLGWAERDTVGGTEGSIRSWASLAASLLVICSSAALTGATYSRNHVYASEENFWRDVTVKAPHNVNAWLGLGSVYLKDPNDPRVDECFRQALQLAPDAARPQATYAGLLITQGKFDEAEKLLERARQAEPGLKEVVINQGLLLSLTGKFAEAQPYLEAAVQAAPEDEELQTNLIANLCYLRQFSQALTVAEANLQRRPGSARATNDVAACLLSAGRTREAEDYARRAIQLDPNLARAHATLGMIVSNRSDDEAIALLEKACQLDPSSFEFLSALATLKMNNQPDAAIKLYHRVLALRPTDVETMLRLAMAYDAIGKPKQAIPILEEALKLQPDLHPVRNYMRSLQFKIQ